MKRYSIIIATLIALALSVPLSAQSDQTNKRAYAKALDVIGGSMALLSRYFVDSVDLEKLSRTGIDAMLQSLDPYTEYYSKEDNDKLKMLTAGEYAGVGAIISQRPDSTVIFSEPMEGMPATLAGIRAGDIILEVDGKNFRKSTSELVSSALKGAPGSKVSILIQRPGEKKPRLVSFNRQKVVINPVPYYGLTKGGYGYINLASFTNNATSEVRRALLELKEKHQIKGLILDLRGNGGGLMNEAIKIVNLFVPEGQIVASTKGRPGSKEEESYRTTTKPLDTEIPLIVLINGESASSSEIVAGALQDMDRAVILGQKSYGKGLVQSTLSLPHDGTLKLTTAKYYIPSGRCIQRIDYHEMREGHGAKEVPDSLRALFHTAAGRPVRDAGGILPDITIKNDSLPTMIYYLSYNPDVFDWVTSYVQRAPDTKPPISMQLSDADYADFSRMLLSKKFDYDRQSIKALDKLRDLAEFEGHLGSAQNLIDSLKKALEPNLEKDLKTLRPHIEHYLTTGIITRYYHRRGALQRELMRDTVINEADKILSDPRRYRQILAPQPKAR